MLKYNLKVSELIKLSPTSKAIRLDLKGKPFFFNPGQFIILQKDLNETKKFKIEGNKNTIQRRSFSLSSFPGQKYLEVTVKITKDPFFSDYLVNYLEEGEEFLIVGPFGMFYLDEKHTNQNISLIGAGSGISPLMSMLRYIHTKNLNIKTHLIFSNKTENEILWRKEIENLSKSKNISHQFTLTQEKSRSKEILNSRITKEIIKENLKYLEKTDFYICGPPEFVKEIEKILDFDLKIPRKNIRKEVYD